MFPFEVKLGRNYYARSSQIVCWLLDHVGPGHAYEYTNQYVHSDAAMWKWDQMFGHTTIQFKRQEDWMQFKLTWC
jgi:hypothetical protein